MRFILIDRCDLCGGQLQPGKTKLEVWRGEELVVIRDVDADICQQCGEAYISAEVSEHLDHFLMDADDDILETTGANDMRQVVIYPGEDGFWVAECPSLPGCISQGQTRQEVITNIQEAIRGYVSALDEDHLPVPAENFEALLVAV